MKPYVVCHMCTSLDGKIIGKRWGKLPGYEQESDLFESTAASFGFVGYYLAAELPPLLAGALLFLTPMSFLLSTARNAKAMMDKLALVLGLLLGTILTATHVQLDLMWTGIGGGTLAYVIHRLREATA